MITLTISHHIFLNKEQRYDLHNREDIEVIGTSVPVWHWNNGETTEPANEIFCKYYLTNIPEDYPLCLLPRGYQINIPQISEQEQLKIDSIRKIGHLEWNKMSKQKQESFYSMIGASNSTCLLNYEDHGNKFLFFKCHQKEKFKGKIVDMTHFIHMRDLDDLIDSII